MKWLTLIFILLVLEVNGQLNPNIKPIPAITLGLHYGFIFAHSEEVQNTAGANPFGIDLIYSKQLVSENAWQQCNCYLNSGFGANYFNYDNSILGHSGTIYYLFEPQFKITNKSKFIIDAIGGLSYLSNPFHPQNNPNNRSYSLPISIYVGLGVGLQYAVSNKFQLALTGNYLHISNGGIKDPNKGINWPTANLKFVYNTQPNNLPKFTKKAIHFKMKNRLDLTTFVSSKTVAIGEKERFFVYGANLNFSRQISSLNALVVGNELIIDNSLKEKLLRDSLNKSNIRYGLTFGHEFLLGNFIFSQQLGYYLFNDTKYFNSIYHRWGLTYQFKNNIGLGVNLLAHAQVANFIDFRMVYSFKK